MKVLIVSHAHPAFSIGGAQGAAYSLYNGLNRLPDTESHFLAHVGPPMSPHRDTPFLSLRQDPRELLFFANSYDYFRLSNKDLESLDRHLARYLEDVQPDIVHFHHFLGFGMESIRVVRRTLPRAMSILPSATTTARWSRRRLPAVFASNHRRPNARCAFRILPPRN
jgi:glycosyltransferase involved in cell wall biosynthesis